MGLLEAKWLCLWTDAVVVCLVGLLLVRWRFRASGRVPGRRLGVRGAFEKQVAGQEMFRDVGGKRSFDDLERGLRAGPVE